MTKQLGLVADLLGYAGAGIIALAYLANQSGRLRSEDWRYPGLNLLGSALVLVSLAVHPNAPSVAIEIFWAGISIYGLQRSLRARKRARS